MIETIESKLVKARKQYICDTAEFITELIPYLHRTGLTFSEYRAIATARKNGFKILKGDTYLYQRNVYDGDLYTFRAIPELHDICIKYKLYPEL